MSDEQQNVEAGSETSGEQADTTVQTDAETSTDTAQADSADAGGAADETAKHGSETSQEVAPSADESRTDFVSDARPGDECTCPDGRKGTVHSFDAGLVCIPNADQG
jgi:hypothetical protein